MGSCGFQPLQAVMWSLQKYRLNKCSTTWKERWRQIKMRKQVAINLLIYFYTACEIIWREEIDDNKTWSGQLLAAATNSCSICSRSVVIRAVSLSIWSHRSGVNMQLQLVLHWLSDERQVRSVPLSLSLFFVVTVIFGLLTADGAYILKILRIILAKSPQGTYVWGLEEE